jgi:hypothetical protein
MEITLAEVAVLGAAVFGLYRLLEPFRRSVERMLLRLLGSAKADVIDVKKEE